LSQNLQLEIVVSKKSQNVSKAARPLYFTHPPFLNSCVRESVKTWRTGACHSFQDKWNIFNRVMSWRWVKLDFIH
jgi:hypothetical protein